MIRASHLIALPLVVVALAACGDDTSSTTGSGGGGGASSSTSDASTSDASTSDASTSAGQGGDASSSASTGGEGGGTGGSGTGGGATYDCAAFCESVQVVADELACGEIADCETDYCDEPSSACAAEQAAVYTCLTEEASTAACFCEGDGEIECEDICLPEAQALDACEAPIQDACIAADDAIFEGVECESPLAFYGSCLELGDRAHGAGCEAELAGYTDCVIADAGASCTCADPDGEADCDGVCQEELEAVEVCIGG